MSHLPETHPSLIVRIRDPDDREAWFEFAEVYRPVIIRLARAKGLQDADADDLAQQVMVSVAGAIERFEADDKRARFRTWLRRIVENAVLNTLTRAKPDRAAGDSETRAALTDEPAVTEWESEQLETEYRREVFRWAALQIRGEFQDDSWQAFWETAVNGRDVDEVAATLGKRRGAVYAARSRIMRRLKEKVLQFEQ